MESEIEEELMELSMVEILSNLGSNISNLSKQKIESCYDTICSIHSNAEDVESAMQFTQMLRRICNQERCVLIRKVFSSLGK